MIKRDEKGRAHCLDGPAITYVGKFINGKQEWYSHGHLHRVDGPAITRASGRLEWYHRGKLHRVDGPAVIRADGSKEWWVLGDRMRSSAEFQHRARITNEEMLALVIKYGDVT